VTAALLAILIGGVIIATLPVLLVGWTIAAYWIGAGLMVGGVLRIADMILPPDVKR
jgi:hypothetical protein